jgi:hypothetical protein
MKNFFTFIGVIVVIYCLVKTGMFFYDVFGPNESTNEAKTHTELQTKSNETAAEKNKEYFQDTLQPFYERTTTDFDNSWKENYQSNYEKLLNNEISMEDFIISMYSLRDDQLKPLLNEYNSLQIPKEVFNEEESELANIYRNEMIKAIDYRIQAIDILEQSMKTGSIPDKNTVSSLMEKSNDSLEEAILNYSVLKVKYE